MPSGTTARLVQSTHYYPFGLEINSLAYNLSPGAGYDYKYNGKELQTDFGLGWYDYGARMYDATLGRWHGVDALAEVYDSFSPFCYVLNNPILLIDLFGFEPDSSEIDESQKVMEAKTPIPEIVIGGGAASQVGHQVLSRAPWYSWFWRGPAYVGQKALGVLGWLFTPMEAGRGSDIQSALLMAEEGWVGEGGQRVSEDPATTEEVWEEAEEKTVNRTGTRNGRKDGGNSQAKEDFDRQRSPRSPLRKIIVQGKPGWTSFTEKGDKIIYREHSREGSTTVEIQHSKPFVDPGTGKTVEVTKIRYNGN